MIFAISEEFLALEGDEIQRYSAAVQNLVIAHAQGWHLFVPSREVSQLLLEKLQLSDVQSQILKGHILGRHADLMGQARQVSRLLYCVPDGSSDLGVDERCIAVPLSEYADLECCLKAQLVVENAARDGSFYKAAASELFLPGSAKIPLSFDVQHGGGGSLADELGRRGRTRRPLLAIVDSDRRYPEGRRGDTALRAQAKREEIDNPVISLLETKGRSIENFVPLELWRAALEEDNDALKALFALEKCRSQEVVECAEPEWSILLYYSLKKGLKFGDYRKAPVAFRKFLDIYIYERGGSVDIADFSDASRDDDIILPRVGGAAFDKLLSLVDSNRNVLAELQEFLADHPIEDDFRALMAEVVAFGIGGRRIPLYAGA